MADAFAQNKQLGRGVNVIGYDPLWRGDQANTRFRAEYFKMLRDAGFDHVRINLHPFRDVKPGPDHKLTAFYLDTLDWALDESSSAGLMAVVDFHEFTEMAKDPASKKDRFLAIWMQLAERCKGRPDSVLFELLNEPHGELTPEMWNGFLREALTDVRKTNPGRTVIIGGGHWNSIGGLEPLSLPDDPNLIVTVHYYHPMEFTHQGAPWSSNHKDKTGITWTGSDADQQAVQRDFDKADAWAKQNNRPLYLGEFGAYDAADMASRVRYTGFVAREAERRGWSWAYWQLDNDFVLFDTIARKWSEPIRNALIPR